MDTPRTVKQIIHDSGGPDAIAKASETRSKPVSAWAVYKWPRNGIPEEHWDMLKDLCGAEPGEIYSANSALRKAA